MARHLLADDGAVMLMRASCDDAAARAESFLEAAPHLFRSNEQAGAGALRWGVDLGTATIVIAAVDSAGRPAYWDFLRAGVVRDGVVVDFHGAVDAVRRLKAHAEAVLGVGIEDANAAYPPGVPSSDCRACAFVLQQAGIECRRLVDEVSAANALLQVADGAVVDVGGGSTGVGVYRDGSLARQDDMAGGGHHLDLIVAGALRITVDEAEARKRSDGAAMLQILRPGIERIAESIRRQCGSQPAGAVHLAGGALQLPGADAVIENYLGWPVRSYPNAELITPFGIALS